MMELAILALSLFFTFSSANPVLPSISNLKDSSQLPLNLPETSNPSTESTTTTTLEFEGLWIFGIPAYITPIAVGTPNQVFRVYLDLDFDGLLVRDITCGESTGLDCGFGGDLGFLYNGSASSTYEDGDEKFSFMLPATNIRGKVGRDDVVLNSLSLDNVTLGAVDEFYGENYFLLILSDIADGALGLSPPNATAQVPYSSYPTSNILTHIRSDSAIANPIITFSLPPYGIERGSITLGALPRGHEKVDSSIPFGDLSSGWNLPMSGLTLAGEKKTVELDTENLKVHPTFSPSLLFPSNLTQRLYSHLRALPDPDREWGDVRPFNCSFRGSQPDITFSFPDTDAKISFSEEEYTLHGFLGDEEVCLLTIMEHEDEGMEEVVAVGTMLWEKWHVVFNLEGKSMGLIEREEEEEDRLRALKPYRDEARIEGLKMPGKGGRLQ